MVLGAREGADDSAARIGGRPRPPVQTAHERVGERQQRWPAVGLRRVKQQPAALIGITLARRTQPLVYHGRRAIRHRAQPVPGDLAQRMTARLSFNGGDEPEFGNEALVVRGKLPADTRGEGITDQLSFQQERGLAPPSLALAKPREGAARRQQPGGFGDHVVVGRGAPAGERGEVLLVPADLPHGERVALEQVDHARPVIQQAPDPGQADQADPELDAAGPVHAGQERVLPPPGAQMIGDPACVPLVLGEEPGGGQQREVLQPGELPDLLDVTDLLLCAVIDAERVLIRVGPSAGHRVAEPVGPLQVGAEHPQGFPLTLLAAGPRPPAPASWPPQAPARRCPAAAPR